MATVDVTQAVRNHTADGEIVAVCAACSHPRAMHDRIAARYCTASTAGKLSRGCVCAAAHADHAEPHSKDEDTR